VNITKIETIIEDIKQSQKEKISMDDTQGMLDILKAKDQYVLEMENSLYSSWAFGRVKITGRVLLRGGILKKGKFCRKDIFNLTKEISCLTLESLVFLLSFISTEIRIRGMFTEFNKYLLVLISVCAVLLIVMTIIRFISNNFFLKSKNIEKKHNGLSESKLKTEIIWTLLFCCLTPNFFFESDDFTLKIFDEETGKLDEIHLVIYR
jgi:hypothetical protein